MAVVYSTAVKTARMTATRDYFADGSLELLDGSNNVIATWGLSGSGGTIATTFWTITVDSLTVTAGASGTVTAARLKNAAGTAGLTGLTAGTSGTDVIISPTNVITSGQNLTLVSAVIGHA